ncbi:MAG: hypothetical protein ACP5G4_07215, partial [bacterium]
MSDVAGNEGAYFANTDGGNAIKTGGGTNSGNIWMETGNLQMDDGKISVTDATADPIIYAANTGAGNAVQLSGGNFWMQTGNAIIGNGQLHVTSNAGGVEAIYAVNTGGGNAIVTGVSGAPGSNSGNIWVRNGNLQIDEGQLTIYADSPPGTEKTFNVDTDGNIYVRGDIYAEGSTDDANETRLTFADPTASNVITFPDASGTVALAEAIPGSQNLASVINEGNVVTDGSGNESIDMGGGTIVDNDDGEVEIDDNLLVQGNATVTGDLTVSNNSIHFTDGSATATLSVPAISAARAMTLPDADGEISVLGQSIEETELAMTTHGTATEDGYLLSFDQATGGFTWLNPGDVGSNTLAGLDDVDVTGLADGQIIKWNATDGEWQVADDEGGVGSINASAPLEVDVATGDVTVSITDGTSPDQILQWNGTNWVAVDAVGNRTYTEDNYVTDGQTVTASIDALDQAVKDNEDAISTFSSNEIKDSDNDTRVTTENAPDEDYIRFYTVGTEQGNIAPTGDVWFDKDMYLGGGLHVQETGSDVMNIDGVTGQIWTSGDIRTQGDLYFENEKDVRINNSVTFKDAGGVEIIQFTGGAEQLTWAHGSIISATDGSHDIGGGTNQFRTVYLDESVRFDNSDAATISPTAFPGGTGSTALYIGERKILVYGEQGSNWFDGSGVPGAGIGDDGDYYLDNDNSDYYYKDTGAWTLLGNLRGIGWFSGDGDPIAGSPYKPGDLWFNTEEGTEGHGDYWIYVDDPGGDYWTNLGNLEGPRGSRGEQGATIHTGTGTPAWDLGTIGDYYIQKEDEHRYLWGPKLLEDEWPATYDVDLVGPAGGRTVHNGTVDPDGSIGIEGDFYINTTSNEIWGPKEAAGWPSPGISLVGPAGPAGAEGAAGADGVGLEYDWDGTQLGVKREDEAVYT